MAYNPMAAYAYAHKWAYSRNPRYANFSQTQYGDSTNFVSQCLFAGSGIMNTTSRSGWYYWDRNNFSQSWVDAEALYTFLTTNQGVGPYGYLASMQQAQPGDVVQISLDGRRYVYSLLVVATRPEILVALHDYDSDYRRLDDIRYARRRLIHIVGSRGTGQVSPGTPGSTLPPNPPGWGTPPSGGGNRPGGPGGNRPGGGGGSTQIPPIDQLIPGGPNYPNNNYQRPQPF